MSKILKAGVIGAGVFGGYHARKFAELDQAEFVGVFDPRQDAADELARTHGGRGFATLDALLSSVDVVTVATPADTHADLALAALSAGKSVYVEKPVARDMEQGEAMVSLATNLGLVLAVGHQERAVFRAMGLFSAPEKPLLMESVRKGTASTRNLDVSVVLDLMIHDLDLALSLTTAEVLAVEAEGECVSNDTLDFCRAEATFMDGFTAIFESSRVAEARERTMRLVYPSGTVEIDFIARTFTNSTRFELNRDFADSEGGRDPLGVSVTAFLEAVAHSDRRPLVTGREALLALDLAMAVEHACGV
jgi:predicted dehydrogenase